jgi:hypothetical protein
MAIIIANLRAAQAIGMVLRRICEPVPTKHSSEHPAIRKEAPSTLLKHR